MIYYAGIGSRTTPENILHEMNQLAIFFATKNWVLRSGGADGADTEFALGCNIAKGQKEIFLPWKHFNNNSSALYDIPDEAFTISEKYHPTWNTLRAPVKKLMARNAQQILGKNLDSPSTLVVCYTPDGCTNHQTRTKATGGTGQAISIASEYGIPVFNLQNKFAIDELQEFIQDIK